MDELVELPVATQETESEKQFLQTMFQAPNFDNDRERRYSGFRLKVEDLAHTSSLGTWLAGYLNETFQPSTPFVDTDFSSLEVPTKPIEVQTFSQRYSRAISRPVIKLSSEDYKKIGEKTGDKRVDSTYGVVLSGGPIDKDPFTKDLQVIVVNKDSERAIRHETKHSIDPNKNKRIGQNAILDEFIAFWEETMLPQDPKSVSWITDIMAAHYYSQYRTEFPDQTNYEQKVRSLGDNIERLTVHYSPEEVDRILMNAKSIDEISMTLQLTTER